MYDKNKNDVIFLENFLKLHDVKALIPQQPNHVTELDIFQDDNNNSKDDKNKKDILKSCIPLNSTDIKPMSTRYKIINEETVFTENDSKKSIIYISKIKNDYKNKLFYSIIKNSIINDKLLHSMRTRTYMSKKSIIDLNFLCEMKMKNVSIQFKFIFLVRSAKIAIKKRSNWIAKFSQQ